MAGRRRHDQRRDLRALHLERAALQFEAGTPDIAGAIGLGAAIDYVTAIGMDRIQAHERDLLAYGTAALAEVPGLRLVGTAPAKASILSFVIDGVHPHDPDHRRSRGRRHSHRPSLRAAGDGPAGHPGDGAGLAGALQHARRHRRAGRALHAALKVFG